MVRDLDELARGDVGAGEEMVGDELHRSRPPHTPLKMGTTRQGAPHDFERRLVVSRSSGQDLIKVKFAVSDSVNGEGVFRRTGTIQCSVSSI
jgi:hypothetical protein